MKTKHWISALVLALAFPVSAVAQDDDDFRKDFENFRKKAHKDYDDFRKQCLVEYSDFVRQAWKPFNVEPAVPMPKEEEMLPMLAPGADAQTASWFSKQMDKLKESFKKRNKPVPAQLENPQPQPQPKKAEQKKPEVVQVKEVLKPEPKVKQPEPIAEVKEDDFRANSYKTYSVFGTECRVRIGDNCRFKLADLRSNTVADLIENEFVKTQYDNMLYDCLQERKKHGLSDWAYYQLLKTMTRQFYGEDSNEGVLVQAFLYSQSGYKMRLAHDEDHLYMLAATRHFIYNRSYFMMDGEWYFMFDNRQKSTLSICTASFPKESSLSLQISTAQQLALNPTPERTITSAKNPDFSFTLTSNKNYIDFYETYPSSTVNNNFMTRWAMYANTPLEQGIRDQLYPPMRQKLQGLNQQEAVQQLLWWVQTGLDYQYDEEIWGEDRAFFGEESLFYPFCDCEDRSILLSHLVRELVGLDVVLIYYPGHLAMAVEFTEPLKGSHDVLIYENRKFVVCDPTYIGSRVGETMPMVQGQPTTLILLQKQS